LAKKLFFLASPDVSVREGEELVGAVAGRRTIFGKAGERKKEMRRARVGR
jgi:hypothetical protein